MDGNRHKTICQSQLQLRKERTRWSWVSDPLTANSERVREKVEALPAWRTALATFNQKTFKAEISNLKTRQASWTDSGEVEGESRTEERCRIKNSVFIWLKNQKKSAWFFLLQIKTDTIFLFCLLVLKSSASGKANRHHSKEISNENCAVAQHLSVAESFPNQVRYLLSSCVCLILISLDW